MTFPRQEKEKKMGRKQVKFFFIDFKLSRLPLNSQSLLLSLFGLLRRVEKLKTSFPDVSPALAAADASSAVKRTKLKVLQKLMRTCLGFRYGSRYALKFE